MAVIPTTPRVEGFQEQVALKELLLIEIHPGIFFLFAKKVTFPSEPASPMVAVSDEVSRKDAEVGALREIDEADTKQPPVPFTTKRKVKLSPLVVKVAPESVDSRIRPTDHPDIEPVVTADMENCGW